MALLVSANEQLKSSPNNSDSAGYNSNDIQSLLNRLEALESAQVTNTSTSTARNTETTVCKVDGCTEKARGKGFCSRHYAKWRRGTLKGYVAYDATVTVNGQTIELDESLVGSPFTETENGIQIGDQVYPFNG